LARTGGLLGTPRTEQALETQLGPKRVLDPDPGDDLAWVHVFGQDPRGPALASRRHDQRIPEAQLVLLLEI
jgi:hypothetical protein